MKTRALSLKGMIFLPFVAVAGCAQEPPAETVKASIVQVIGDSFCPIMAEIAGPTRKLTWDVNDSPQTIHGVRRLARAVDKRCVSQKQSKPTT